MSGEASEAGTVDRPRRWFVWELRHSTTAWIDRHEMAWELGMAGLAITYVVLGALSDDPDLASSISSVELAITAIFVAEFLGRTWAAASRRTYVVTHIPDLIALIPAARGLRLLRLVRLVRLIRTVPVIYRHLGLDLPIVRRIGWHAARVRAHVDKRLAMLLGGFVGLYIVAGALVVTLTEKDWTIEAVGESLYWAVNTALGSGDPGYVATIHGWALSWSLIGMSLTILAVVTGGVVTFVIDVALKEGTGMGAAGFEGHIVVCGWNASARELIEELRDDEYGANVVLVTEADKNPAGEGVYFVNGDPTNPDDLARAGIREASTAVVFPGDESDAADMQSILVVLAVESMAPGVRTVVQVNNSRHAEHLRRANADEIVVPAQIAAHLAARSALYPGLTELVADLVSGGEGSELYRIQVPATYAGQRVGDFAAALMWKHHATLLAITRQGRNVVNPPADMIIEPEDDALVVAESVASLGKLDVERAVAEA